MTADGSGLTCVVAASTLQATDSTHASGYGGLAGNTLPRIDDLSIYELVAPVGGYGYPYHNPYHSPYGGG